MPSGWIRLMERATAIPKPDEVYKKMAEMDAFKATGVCLSAVESNYEYQTRPLFIALGLLREMATALESYAADSFDATSGADFDDEGQGKLARSVLKKFREWK